MSVVIRKKTFCGSSEWKNVHGNVYRSDLGEGFTGTVKVEKDAQGYYLRCDLIKDNRIINYYDMENYDTKQGALNHLSAAKQKVEDMLAQVD